MLYAGEGNVRNLPPPKVIEGVVEIVKTIREKQPDVHILVQVISAFPL